MTKRKKVLRLPPELQKGIRIDFRDRDGKRRTERIRSVSKTTVTIVNVLGQKTRVRREQIIGYWQKKVKASPSNMIKLEEL